MPFNLLLLPLLGGYILLTLCNRTKFETKRYSGERLIFHAAIVGVFLLLGAFVLAQLTARFAPSMHQAWLAVVPFTYAGTSFVAFLIGCVLWWPLNRWCFRLEVEQRRVILEWGDNLEELLEQAIRETKQVSITMTNGKVYAGFPTVNINPAYERRYVKLLPTSSGFRDPNTHPQSPCEPHPDEIGDALTAADWSRGWADNRARYRDVTSISPSLRRPDVSEPRSRLWQG
jgi:hypothetical protein